MGQDIADLDDAIELRCGVCLIGFGLPAEKCGEVLDLAENCDGMGSVGEKEEMVNAPLLIVN
jgi:hypothetical protein